MLLGEECILYNIPEGNKKESPTSYMSLTNQKYKSVEVAEAAESKENKAPGIFLYLNSQIRVFFFFNRGFYFCIESAKSTKAAASQVFLEDFKLN